jgi:hypothetical protein
MSHTPQMLIKRQMPHDTFEFPTPFDRVLFKERKKIRM